MRLKKVLLRVFWQQWLVLTVSQCQTETRTSDNPFSIPGRQIPTFKHQVHIGKIAAVWLGLSTDSSWLGLEKMVIKINTFTCRM